MNTQLLPQFIVSVRGTFGNVLGHLPQGQRLLVSLFLLGMLLTLGAGSAPPHLQTGRLGLPPRGFNHNGYGDLAIGAPYENVGTNTDAGGVNVLYGGLSKLSTAGNQYWSQGNLGILNTAEVGDRFGEALTYGDFDCDGYFDLAIGVPMEDVGTTEDAGAVHILYGSRSGLGSARNQYWSQADATVYGDAETSDQFGAALAAGDFNGDGCDDLAVGAPLEDAGVTNNGGVNILYGAPSGLTGGNQMLYQGHDGLVGTAVAEDRFGSALAAGDFNGDGRDDLAVGIPLKDDGALNNGAVVIAYGSSLGLRGTGSTLWSQHSADVEGNEDDNDQFGSALAAGDIDGDGYDDLAIGVPFMDRDPVTIVDSGAVNFLYGSSGGISAAGDQIRDQSSPGIPGDAAGGDHFGAALAMGDFNRDGYADIAIGIPKKHDRATDDGGVVVIYGTSAGVNNTNNDFWSQGEVLVQGVPEDYDQFGTAVAAGDFDGDGYDDLAIGVPFDNVDSGGSTIADAGAVNVLYGGVTGLTVFGDQIFTQADSGMVTTGAEVGDRFGSALAAPRAQPVVYLPLLDR